MVQSISACLQVVELTGHPAIATALTHSIAMTVALPVVTSSKAAQHLMDALIELATALAQQRHGSAITTVRRFLRDLLAPMVAVAPTGRRSRARATGIRAARTRCVALVQALLDTCTASTSDGATVAGGGSAAVVALLHNACVQVKDKADSHSVTSAVILKVLTFMPAPARAAFVRFLHTYSRSKKVGRGLATTTAALQVLAVDTWLLVLASQVNFRQFAATLAASMLQDVEVWGSLVEAQPPLQAATAPPAPVSPTVATSPAQSPPSSAAPASPAEAVNTPATAAYTPSPSPAATPGVVATPRASTDERPGVTLLLDIVLRRASDRAPSVRAKALAGLASVLSADRGAADAACCCTAALIPPHACAPLPQTRFKLASQRCSWACVPSTRRQQRLVPFWTEM